MIKVTDWVLWSGGTCCCILQFGRAGDFAPWLGGVTVQVGRDCKLCFVVGQDHWLSSLPDWGCGLHLAVHQGHRMGSAVRKAVGWALWLGGTIGQVLRLSSISIKAPWLFKIKGYTSLLGRTDGFIRAQVWLSDGLCSCPVLWSDFLVGWDQRLYWAVGQGFKFASLPVWLCSVCFTAHLAHWLVIRTRKNCPSGAWSERAIDLAGQMSRASDWTYWLSAATNVTIVLVMRPPGFSGWAGFGAIFSSRQIQTWFPTCIQP